MQRRVVQATSTGGPEVLAPGQLTVPELTSGQLRVAVDLAGVNFWDVMQRRGDVPLPADRVPGVEGTGIVAAVGDGVDPGLVGQRVAWSRVPSSYSDIVQGPQESFLLVPDGVSDEAASGCLMQGVTAHYLATSTTNLSVGQTAVVTAAAGGVGRLLTQFLQQRGVTVVGVVSTLDKVAGACAGHTLVATPALGADVRDLHPNGVDAVFDASGEGVEPLLAMLRPRGICVIYGAASGMTQSVSLSALSAGSLYLTRTAGRDYSATPAEWRSRAEAVMAAVASGALTIAVSQVAPLAEAAAVHDLLETRRTTGKVLLRARN